MKEYLIILMTFHCVTQARSLRTYTQEEHESKAGGGRGNFCIILRKNSYKINETSKQNTTNGKTNKLWALRTTLSLTLDLSLFFPILFLSFQHEKVLASKNSVFKQQIVISSLCVCCCCFAHFARNFVVA